MILFHGFRTTLKPFFFNEISAFSQCFTKNAKTHIKTSICRLSADYAYLYKEQNIYI